jgi:hypothetical protein
MNPNNNPPDRQNGKVSSIHLPVASDMNQPSNQEDNDGVRRQPSGPHNGDSTTNMSLFSLLMQGTDPSNSLPPPLWPSPLPPPPNDMLRSEFNNVGRSSSLSAIHQALTLVEEMEEFLPSLSANPSVPLPAPPTQQSSTAATLSRRQIPLYSRSASPPLQSSNRQRPLYSRSASPSQPQQQQQPSQQHRRTGTDDDSASRQ